MRSNDFRHTARCVRPGAYGTRAHVHRRAARGAPSARYAIGKSASNLELASNLEFRTARFKGLLKINVLLLIHERWWLMTTKNLFLDQNVYDGKIRLRV